MAQAEYSDLDQTPGTVESSAPAVRPALAVAADSGLSSDRVVQFDNLSRALGRPEPLVRETFEQSVQERQARQLEKTPNLAAWAATDPARAALAADDVDGMTRLFNYLDVRKNAEAVSSAWDRGGDSLEMANLGERFLAGDEKASTDIAAFAKAAQEKAKARNDNLLVNDIWLTSGAEQLPRMLQTQIPAGTEALGMGLAVWGASTLATAGTGAAAGSLVPGAGTLAGGAVGAASAQPAAVGAGLVAAKTSYPIFSALRNYPLEKGIFAYEMSQERDVDGNPLDRDVIDAASTVYGAAAGLLEGFTEAGFLSLLKAGGAGKTLGALAPDAVKEAVKAGVKRMALDKVARNRLADLAGRVSIGALMEGGTEYLQEWASIITDFVAKESSDQFFPGNEAFSEENRARALEAGKEGFKAGIWLRGAPIAASSLLDNSARADAERFAEEARGLFREADGAAIKGKSPDITQEILESQGVTEQASIPAFEALRLYQSGFEALPDAMGYDLDAIRNAAARGHDLEVPISRLVSRLDAVQFESVLDVARRSPESLSLADMRDDDALSAETRRVLETFREQQAQETDYENALQSMQSAMTQAVAETPGLSAMAEARAGSVDSFINDQMAFYRGFAERNIPDPGRRAEFIRNVIFQSELGERLASDPVNRAEQEEALTALVRDADDQDIFAGKTFEAKKGTRVTFKTSNTLHGTERNGNPFTVAYTIVDDGDFDNTVTVGAGGNIARPGRYRVRRTVTYENEPTQTQDLDGDGLWFNPERHRASADGVLTFSDEKEAQEWIARDMATMGVQKADGLELPPDAGPLPDLADLGETFTPEEYARLQDQQALMESMGITPDMSEVQRARRMTPWLDAVWGRLDGASLRADWPDAFKAIVRNYGPGVFRSREKGGIPADYLAAELVESNLFQQGMGADELVERLKAPRDTRLFQTAPPVESEAFKKWFGDSRVVDESGNPLVVSHATMDDFEAFDMERSSGVAGAGGYFTDAGVDERYGNREIQAYLSIQNPIDLRGGDRVIFAKQKELLGHDMTTAASLPAMKKISQDFRKALMKAGFDGVIMGGEKAGEKYYVAFSPEQIKSVNNRGTFDPADPRILYQTAGEQSARQRFDASPTASVAGTEIFNEGNPFPEKMSERRNAVIEWLHAKGWLKSFSNKETGWDINVSRQSIRDTGAHGIDEGKAQVLAALPEIIENAVYIAEGRTTDSGNRRHIFAAKVDVGGKEFVVGVVIDEHKNGKRFYNHELTTIKDLDGPSLARQPEGIGLPEANQGLSVLDIVRKHLGVNPDIILPQGRKRHKGHVSIRGEVYTVTLGKDADLSTIVHETAHIFQAELGRLEAAGLADERMLADMRTLDAWLSRFDDDAALKQEYDKRLRGLPGFEKPFTKLTTGERERARDAARREYFARGFEAYVREGNAPSEGMRAVFERFKRWLLAIYKADRALGVELNDEVRGVFDRMIATEQEIEATAAANELFSLTRQQLDALGLTGPDREYAANLIKSAKERAAALVDREKNRGRAERRKTWADEARAELMELPVYAARAAMRAKGGHINAEALSAVYGEEAAALLRKKVGPGAVRKEGGHDPDIFAREHGFSDGAQLLAAIRDNASMTTAIKEIVDAKEAEHDAGIDPAQHLLRTEEAARQLDIVGEYLARSLGNEAVQGRAIRVAARETLLAMPMRKARAHKEFTAAMRHALKHERSAVAKGDFKSALRANTQARLNLELARQAMDINAGQEGTVRQIKRFTGMAKADPNARYIVNDIAMRYALGRYDARLADGRDATTIRNWVAAREEDGYPMGLDDGILYGPGQDWRDVSLSEFETLVETVRQVVVVERNTRRLLTDAEKADFAAAEEALVGTIHTYRDAKPIKLIEEDSFIKRGLRTAHASHTKIEALCLALDGGNALGENWTRIYKPINDAEIRRGQLFKALQERLQGAELFGAYSDREVADMSRRKEYVPALGESITKGQRIMMALNMGNDGNFKRMQAGGGYTEEQIHAATATLDKRDWTFVQGIWDTFERYKAEAFALQEEVTGQRPTSVEAQPLTVTLPGGETMALRGGYFPVLYSYAHAAPDISDKLLSGDKPAFAMTRHGHLKERTATGAGTPLDFNMGGIVRALNDVITDLSFRRAYIDVGRMLRSRQYRLAIESTVGPEMYQAMVGWLKNAARENRVNIPGEPLARWSRITATTMAMGFKVTTMLAQPLGITQTIDQIGFSDTMQGLGMAYGGGPRGALEMTAWVREVSPMMDQRMKNYDRDVTDALSDFARQDLTPGTLLDAATPQAVRPVEKWLKKNAFVPMAVMQFGVDLPTWLGAYSKGLRDFGGSDIKARDYADSMVRLTQGSGQAKDLAGIQRGPEIWKLFTMFYSYFNTLYNLTALRAADVNMHRDAASVIRAANSFLFLVAVPAVFSQLVVRRGPDDDEEWYAWAAKQMMLYPLQSVVLARDVAQSAIEGKYRYKSSPAEDVPEAMVNYIKEINKMLFDPDKKFDPKKFGKLTLRTYGYMKGLPLRQAEISAFNVLDFMDGTSDFELLDLFFVKPKGRR